MFPLWHIPALIQATTMTFGGMWPMWDAQAAMAEFGWPARIASAPAAGPVMVQGQARTTVIGLLVALFYLRREYAAVDAVMAVTGFYVGVVDSYLVWRENDGGLSWAAFRLVASWFFGLCGLRGWTASAAW
ncbi:hypothetical protein B0T26DRAFT_732142 [Lasiosphaeria miniovina]|uniref:Uncharacterized protein n=1 Tax=Lasiosphaeria miniovina TaxID=1954250 RepID=A0AA39ZU04_9PEZI|nr:uncharacterized protein B0T26DRAFT_732142 [Lasiosphaeria miniovina]KAK0703652.1 hypothetical protein B0T26DRAFT_732142 [Lasiosphaeria miniovina]